MKTSMTYSPNPPRNSHSSPRRPRPVLKPAVASLQLALLLVSLQAQAQSQVGVPNAGALLQQTQPAVPPAAPPAAPSLRVEAGAAANLPASKPFAVKSIRIVGNSAFSSQTLHALVADAEGGSATLPELAKLAGRITAYYQAHGFPLSRAIVPAQAIGDGQVTIQVVEAHFGAVRLTNASHVDDALLASTLASLRPGQAIAERDLDRALLLLSDVAGVGVDAVIKPGAAVGAADLEVTARHKPTTFASVVLDNAGNRYIGRTRLGVSAFLTNLLRHGDVLDASIISTGHGMDYGRLGYEALLSGQGTRAGAAYSRVHYTLQGDAAALDAYGTAGVSSAWVKQTVVRAREVNLYAQLEYDAKRLRDRIGVSHTRTDRHLGNWVASLNGDLRDNLLGGGVNAWSLGWTRGNTRFDDAAAELADAATARTRGSFSKWNLNASRLQRLGARDALFLNLSAQAADANLDSAEKLSVGGPYSVRAYDIGAVSGDRGAVATVELRHDFGALASGSLEASAFIDSARVTINHSVWTAADNSVSLSGAGIGLAWAGADAWRASLAVATPIGANSALLGPRSSVRGWFSVNKAF